MKFKYYLRGVGCGILVATIILTVSNWLHDDKLTNEEIIAEARKLGMVMVETESETGLFGGSEDSSEKTSESETTTTETEGMTETESQDTQTESESETEIPEGTLITFTIESGEYARAVSEKLFALGLIDDAEAFRVYIGEKGRGQNLIVGTFEIPMGATYDEIIDIITFR